MQLTTFVATLLAVVVSARDFTLYDDSNYGGASHFENRWDDDACCMQRDCQGSNWQNYDDAPTVPGFLNDHIWSFRNKC
ncbi:hypothetical protein BGZ60DRAFT_329635, partial [Tricladium varicosporioides]